MNQSKVANRLWIFPASEVKKIQELKGMFSGGVNHLSFPEFLYFTCFQQ